MLICAASLTPAIELAGRGIAFRTVDRRDSSFPGSRGRGTKPRRQEIFEDPGILDRLVATGGFHPAPTGRCLPANAAAIPCRRDRAC